MLKTIRRRVAFALVVSMLLQLFVGVAPVVANDLSDQNVELVEDVGEDIEKEADFVQRLPVILSPGTTPGAISATVVDDVYGSLIVDVTDEEVGTPHVGDIAPIEGAYLLVGYRSGMDITEGVAVGNYLQIYGIDDSNTEAEKISAFYQVELTAEDIKAAEAEEDIEEEEPLESLMMGMMPMAVEGYSYIDEYGQMKNTGDKSVTKITSGIATLNEGWYIVEGNINRTDTIAVSGQVHLILGDGSSLAVTGNNNAGILVSP